MAEYIELSQAITLFGDVDARFDTVEGKIPSNASSGNKMVTASDIATKADLVDGKVPSSQLPSYVDDVLEYASTSQFPATGESGKIYVATDTNKTYRWGGSDYVEISESLALGETSSTAYAGDKGKANADAISAIEELIPSNATSSNKLATASDIPTVPTKTSDLTNDSNFVADASYVHTDNNYDATAKSTVDSIPLTISQLQGSLLNKVDKETGKGLSTNDYTTADQTALQTTIPLEISQLQASLLTKANASDIPDISGLQPKTLATTIGSYTTVEGALSGINDGKVDKVTGKGLSTNDYDATAKSKVDGMDASIAASQNGSTALTKSTVGWTGKNLLIYPYAQTTKTEGGITFRDNKDGSITILAGTATSHCNIQLENSNIVEFASSIKNKRVILSGGISNNIKLQLWRSGYDNIIDNGSGVEFTFPDLTSSNNWNLALAVLKDTVIESDITIYPMLRDAAISDPTYEPPHKSVEEWGFPRSEQRVLGAKNLLTRDCKSLSLYGIDFTVDEDGIITANGTATNAISFRVGDLLPDTCPNNYIVTGLPSDGSANTFNFRLGTKQSASDASGTYLANVLSKDGYNLNLSSKPTYGIAVVINIASGTVFSNTVFKPMIRLATDPDSTYAPPAMTNRELTEELTVQESAVTDIASGATASVNKLVKYGKVVQCIVFLNSLTLSAGGTLFKTPSGYRPIQNFRAVVFDTTNNNIIKNCTINSNGDVLILGSVSSVNVAINATWITS